MGEVRYCCLWARGRLQTADVLGAVGRLNAIALVGLLVEEVGVDVER